MKRFAGIDIGSHTVRMLVAEERENRLFPVRHFRHITRLAEGFWEREFLSTSRKDQTLRVLAHYRDVLRGLKVDHAFCGATGVVRRASDREAFLRDVEAVLGFPCKILSEKDEAFTAARGTLTMLASLPDKSFTKVPLVIFDLGGGSTEFVVVKEGGLLFTGSVFVGASTITGLFLKKAPAELEQIEEAKRHVDLKLNSTVTEITRRVGSEFEVIGTAGTVATLGAIFLGMTPYEPYRMIGVRLSVRWIEEILKKMAALSIEDRGKIRGLEPGREDVIVGGTLIVHRILSLLGRKEMIISDAGLLEGLTLLAAELFKGITPEGLYSPLTWQF